MTKQLEAYIANVKEDQNPLKLYLKILELKIIPENEFYDVVVDLGLSFRNKILKKLEDDFETPEEEREALLESYIQIASNTADEKAIILGDREKIALFARYVTANNLPTEERAGYRTRDRFDDSDDDEPAVETIQGFGFEKIKQQILYDSLSDSCQMAAQKGNLKLFSTLIRKISQRQKMNFANAWQQLLKLSKRISVKKFLNHKIILIYFLGYQTQAD